MYVVVFILGQGGHLYGGIWLEQKETWVQLGPQAPLGVYVAAERFFQSLVGGLQRFQV